MGFPTNSVVVLTGDSALDYLPPVRVRRVALRSSGGVSSEVLLAEENLHGDQRELNPDHAVVSYTTETSPARSECRVRIFFGPPLLLPLRSRWGESLIRLAFLMHRCSPR